MTAILILERVWVLCQDEAIELIIKDPFLITSYNLIKKWNIRILQMHHWTHFKMWNSLTSTFMWNSFIRFLHQANFHQIVWYYWNADTHYPRHFDMGFVWLGISDVYCQLQMNMLYHLDLQNSYLHCGTLLIDAILFKKYKSCRILCELRSVKKIPRQPPYQSKYLKVSKLGQEIHENWLFYSNFYRQISRDIW